MNVEINVLVEKKENKETIKKIKKTDWEGVKNILPADKVITATASSAYSSYGYGSYGSTSYHYYEDYYSDKQKAEYVVKKAIKKLIELAREGKEIYIADNEMIIRAASDIAIQNVIEYNIDDNVLETIETLLS